MKLNALCRIIGHHWKYKDFSFAIKSDGSKYSFSATRICKRCDKKEYKFSEWIDETLVPLKDIEVFH